MRCLICCWLQVYGSDRGGAGRGLRKKNMGMADHRAGRGLRKKMEKQSLLFFGWFYFCEGYFWDDTM